MDAAKVSRIKAPRKELPQNLWRPPQKRLFVAPAIELTLQRRQLLQPLTAKSVPSFRPKSEEDLYKDTLTKDSSGSSLWGQEAWLSILTGEKRVEIPFSEIGAASHGEEYIQWYEEQRAQKRAAELSGRRGSLMPLGFWRSALTDFALSSLQPSPGECTQLKGRASLLRHLEANGTPQGPKALAESISFRFGGEDRAVLALKKSFGEQMSLLDFAATCGVLDLDLELLAGEEWPLLLAHLFPGSVTIDCAAALEALAIQGDFETPKPEFQRLQAKWWLLGRYLGLSGLRATGDKSQSWEDMKLRLDVQLKHLELCMKPCFMASIGPREATTGPATRQLSQDEWLLFFQDLGEVDAQWRQTLNEGVLQKAFEKAANEVMLTFEAFKGALKNVVEALPGAWDSLTLVAKSAQM